MNNIKFTAFIQYLEREIGLVRKMIEINKEISGSDVYPLNHCLDRLTFLQKQLSGVIAQAMPDEPTEPCETHQT